MLHKKKQRSLCTNYRGISLLDVQGKLYEKILSNRMRAVQQHLDPEHRLPEEQLGFNVHHSTDDAQFCLL